MLSYYKKIGLHAMIIQINESIMTFLVFDFYDFPLWQKNVLKILSNSEMNYYVSLPQKRSVVATE